MKIPAMGFSDYFIQTVTEEKSSTEHSSTTKHNCTEGTDECDQSGRIGSLQKSDQEILESITDIYFQPDSNAEMYELQVMNGTLLGCQTVKGREVLPMTSCAYAFCRIHNDLFKTSFTCIVYIINVKTFVSFLFKHA